MNDHRDLQLAASDCLYVHEINSAQVLNVEAAETAPVAAVAWSDQFMAERPHVIIFCGRDLSHETFHIPLVFRPSDMAVLLGLCEMYELDMKGNQRRNFRRRVDQLKREWRMYRNGENSSHR